jgi:tetratricopeptide (TPR) repeat protein
LDFRLEVDRVFVREQHVDIPFGQREWLVEVEVPTLPDSELEVVEQVSSLVALQEYRKAAELAERGLETYPQSAALLHQKGRAIAGQGEGNGMKALQCFLRAVQISPESPRFWTDLAWRQHHHRLFNLGFRCAQEAIRRDDRCAAAWACLARCEAARGNPRIAYDAHRTAVELKPRDWRIQASMGFLLSNLDRHPEAIVSLRRATELWPDDADVSAELAWCLAAANWHDDARLAAERALQVNDRHCIALTACALVAWERDRDYITAGEYLELAAQIDPESERVHHVGDVVGWSHAGNESMDRTQEG